VYQAPDVMSIVSARLQMASYYLEECLETGIILIFKLWKRIYLNKYFLKAFSHYIFNPSRGYYWDFNQSMPYKIETNLL